jgi:hypothetical protein
MFGALNLAFAHGRGMRRRWKRELQTQDALDWRRDLLAGRQVLVGHHELHHPWRELMYAPLRGRPKAVWDVRARIRRRLDLVVRQGPASGWGVEDPHHCKLPGHGRAQYVVPKASEKCWRWWRRRGRELRRLLRLLDRLWSSLVPIHKPGQEVAGPDRESAALSSGTATRTGVQGPVVARTLVGEVVRRLGM